MKQKKLYLFFVLFVLVGALFCASAAWALPMFGEGRKNINDEEEKKSSTSQEQRERSGGEESESQQMQRGNLSQGNTGIREANLTDQMEGDLTDETSARVLTLVDFTNSINNYPTAARLIIKDGTIQAEEGDPNTAGKNRAENKAIIDALRDIIRPIVPERVDNDLDRLLRYNNSSSVSMAIDPLSSERLRQILENLNLFLKQLDENDQSPDQKSYNPISEDREEKNNLLPIAFPQDMKSEQSYDFSKGAEKVGKVTETDQAGKLVGQQLKAKQDHLQQLKPEVTQKTFLIDQQIKEAKQASFEGKGGENAYLWDRIVTKLEQAKESWHQFEEKTAQGKSERAALWQQAAERSEASAERMKNVFLTYIAGNETEAKRLEKENWNLYILSNAFTWNLKSEEALEKVAQAELTTPRKMEEITFWEKRAEEYKKAADYKREAIEANNAYKESEWNSWFWAGSISHATAEYQIKGAQAKEAGKVTIASEYEKLSQRCESALNSFLKAVADYKAGKIYEGYRLYSAVRSFYYAAAKLGKAIEAEEAGKGEIAQKWRDAAALQESSTEPYSEAAKAHDRGKSPPGDYFDNAGNSLKNAAAKLGKAIEADAAGKVSVAKKWREAAALQKLASKYYSKAAKVPVGVYSSEKKFIIMQVFVLLKEQRR